MNWASTMYIVLLNAADNLGDVEPHGGNGRQVGVVGAEFRHEESLLLLHLDGAEWCARGEAFIVGDIVLG
jgi:hypothetical protein